MPELVDARAEACGGGGQLEYPHPSEAFVITRMIQIWIRGFEITYPSHDSLVIVRTKIVPVLNNEMRFRSARNLCRRRHVAIGENVAVDLGV